MIKFMSPPYEPNYLPCCRVWTMRCWSSELSRKMGSYFLLVGVTIVAECYRLVWGCKGALSREAPDGLPQLHGASAYRAGLYLGPPLFPGFSVVFPLYLLVEQGYLWVSWIFGSEEVPTPH